MIKVKTIEMLEGLNQKKIDNLGAIRAQLQSQISELEEKIRELYKSIEIEKEHAGKSNDFRFAFERFYITSKSKLMQMSVELVDRNLKLDAVIEQMKELYIESKKHEKILSNITLQKEKKALKAEEKMLDEFNTRSWRTSETGSN